MIFSGCRLTVRFHCWLAGWHSNLFCVRTPLAARCHICETEARYPPPTHPLHTHDILLKNKIWNRHIYLVYQFDADVHLHDIVLVIKNSNIIRNWKFEGKMQPPQHYVKVSGHFHLVFSNEIYLFTSFDFWEKLKKSSPSLGTN